MFTSDRDKYAQGFQPQSQDQFWTADCKLPTEEPHAAPHEIAIAGTRKPARFRTTVTQSHVDVCEEALFLRHIRFGKNLDQISPGCTRFNFGAGGTGVFVH